MRSFTELFRKPKLLLFLLAALSIVSSSCTKEEKAVAAEKGKLILSFGRVTIGNQLTAIGTKAAPVPVLSDFNLKIVASSGETVYDGVADEGEHILLTGAYTLHVYYGTDYGNPNNPPFSDAPYYSGSIPVEITAGEQKRVILNASFKGSILKVNLPEALTAHYKSYQLKAASEAGNGPVYETVLTPGKQLFIKGGIPLRVTLEGINQVDEVKNTALFTSSSLANGVIAENTEYIINASVGDLPVITLPSQQEYNSWATRHIISPATLSSGDVSRLIYEAIPAASDDWSAPLTCNGSANPVLSIPANSAERVTYKLRARYGLLTSNIVNFTAEKAEQLPNATFENSTWTATDKGGLWSSGGGNIYHYSYPGWTTNNTPYADAPSGEYKVLWKWGSLVEPDNGTVKISTKGFATKKLGWTDIGVTYVSTIQNSFKSNPVTGNGEFKTDLLPFASRPASISFQYKYTSYPAAQDNCIIYINLYNAARELIASTGTYNGTDSGSFGEITLPFNDTKEYALSEVRYISLYFKSGSQSGVNAAQYVQGSYDASPHGRSEFIGSQLWIDTITLNY